MQMGFYVTLYLWHLPIKTHFTNFQNAFLPSGNLHSLNLYVFTFYIRQDNGISETDSLTFSKRDSETMRTDSAQRTWCEEAAVGACQRALGEIWRVLTNFTCMYSAANLDNINFNFLVFYPILLFSKTTLSEVKSWETCMKFSTQRKAQWFLHESWNTQDSSFYFLSFQCVVFLKKFLQHTEIKIFCPHAVMLIILWNRDVVWSCHAETVLARLFS